MRMLLSTLAVLAFSLTASLARAQAKPAAAAPAAAAPTAGAPDTTTADGVTYKKRTVYDFDDDVVEGDLVRPDGEYVAIKRQAKHSSLIKIREHFIPEMLKSAEDI